MNTDDRNEENIMFKQIKYDSPEQQTVDKSTHIVETQSVPHKLPVAEETNDEHQRPIN